MITTSGIVPVEYPINQVFTESLKSKHIPENINILKLTCRDEILKPKSTIQARVGIFLLKFGMDAHVTELEPYEAIRIAGSSYDAKLNLWFNYRENTSTTSDVNYMLELELRSIRARRAEAMYGSHNTEAVIGSFVTGIVSNVQAGLAETYGPPQAPAA